MFLVSQGATWRGAEVALLNGRFGPIKQELECLYTHARTHTHAHTSCSCRCGPTWEHPADAPSSSLIHTHTRTQKKKPNLPSVLICTSKVSQNKHANAHTQTAAFLFPFYLSHTSIPSSNFVSYHELFFAATLRELIDPILHPVHSPVTVSFFGNTHVTICPPLSFVSEHHLTQRWERSQYIRSWRFSFCLQCHRDGNTGRFLCSPARCVRVRNTATQVCVNVSPGLSSQLHRSKEESQGLCLCVCVCVF